MTCETCSGTGAAKGPNGVSLPCVNCQGTGAVSGTKEIAKESVIESVLDNATEESA